MPNWISKGGLMYPAKERVALTNNSDKPIIVDGKEIQPGEPYIYEGSDRAAEYELAQMYGVDEEGKPKQGYIGIDCLKDPEMIMRAKQLGYNTVDEYARAMGYNPELAEKQIKEKEKVIVKHEQPKKSEGIRKSGGGTDFSGQGEDVYGGFGNNPDGLGKR